MAKPKGTNETKSGKIRVGIGGWTYEPWRGEFYPKRTAACARADLCQRAPDQHRDQRHLLPHAIARHLRQVGEGDAGRLRVLREGRALRHQPQGARGSRRVGRSLPQVGRAGAGRQARSDPVAVHADQEIRSRRLRRLPGAAAEVAAGCGSCAMSWRCGTPRSACRSSSPCCASTQVPVVFAEHATYPAIPDPVGDFVYAAAAEGPGQHRHLLSAQGAGRLGQAGRDLGQGRRAQGSGAGRRRQGRQGCSRATCSSTSSTRARCGPRSAAMEMIKRVGRHERWR